VLGTVSPVVVQVQDEAAGLVVALLDPRPGEAILDACAAPGGKALYAASRMQGQVCVIRKVPCSNNSFSQGLWKTPLLL